MKQIISFLIGLIFITAGTLQAQKIEEFEVNGNVYCYEIRDSIKKIGKVYLKSNKVDRGNCIAKLVGPYTNFNYQTFTHQSLEILGFERLQELAKGKGSFAFLFYCKDDGLIQEVGYELWGLAISNKKGEKSLTPQEIDKINTYVIKEYKKGKFQVDLEPVELKSECSVIAIYMSFRFYSKNE